MDIVLNGALFALAEGILTAIMGGGSSRDWSGEISALERQIEMSDQHHREMERRWEEERVRSEKSRVREIELLRESMEKDLKAQQIELERMREQMEKEREENELRRDQRLNYPIPEWLSRYVSDVEDLHGEKKYVNVESLATPVSGRVSSSTPFGDIRRRQMRHRKVIGQKWV